MIPVVQCGQVDSALGIHMFALPDHHAGCGAKIAYRWRKGERIQQPQLDGQVVGTTYRKRSELYEYVVHLANITTPSWVI